MAQALMTADLIFSDQANHQFSKTLHDIRRSNLSIHNRLQSIKQDAFFAEQVAEIYCKPLVANERCGSWYIDPRRKAGSAYFKSTDGHTSVWKFSTRRLNLHLLDIIGKHDGCTIVDSTRRGKRMPDALSKTIPVWCSVLNRFLFPLRPDCHELYTPPQAVSRSEHEQMTALLSTFLQSFQALRIEPQQLRAKVSKPLRPYWITPDSDITNAANSLPEYHLVVCCTVSRRIEGSEAGDGGYVQGAADDTENWALGLSPSVFWANHQSLLLASEEELPHLIEGLLAQTNDAVTNIAHMVCIKPTTNLFIATGSSFTSDETEHQIFEILLKPQVTGQATWATAPRRLDIGLGPHKIGSRNLRSALPYIIGWLRMSLKKRNSTGCDNESDMKIIISGSSSEDHAVGVALFLLSCFYEDTGVMLNDSTRPEGIDKAFIRQKLAWISASMPYANPSRSTLQSVNSVLMETHPE